MDYSTVLYHGVYKECWERILRQIFMFDALILVRVEDENATTFSLFSFLSDIDSRAFGQGDFAPTAVLSLFIAHRHRLGPVSTSQCI